MPRRSPHPHLHLRTPECPGTVLRGQEVRVRVVDTEFAPAAVGPYSQAIVANGFCFCSGQIALDKHTLELSDQDITGQTALALSNLESVLLAAGATLNTVVKTTVYLTDMDDFNEMNAVYQQVFGDIRPARACVEVSGLPKGAVVEIECVALVRR